MQNLLLTIDKISTFVGQAFSWLIVTLTLLISWRCSRATRWTIRTPGPSTS